MRRYLLILLLSLCVGVSVVAQTESCTGKMSRVGFLKNEKADATSPNVSYYAGQIFISNVSENSVVEVKNMLGENVLVFRMTSTEGRISVDLKRGFYIVRVEDYLQRIVVK